MPSGHVSAQAADAIATVLRQRIIDGHLSPGTALRDGGFATEFRVSRNTMREALRLLRHEGLVEHRVHQGARVRLLSGDDVRDIYAARRCVEFQAIRESAVTAEGTLDRVGAAVERAESAIRSHDWSQVGTASLAFHQALVSLLGSVSLDEFFAGIVARLRLAFAGMEDEGAFQRPWVPRDREIWECIRTGRRDEAEERLRIYLDDSERKVVDVVRRTENRRTVGKRSRSHATSPATTRT